jgi:hypothetical protein
MMTQTIEFAADQKATALRVAVAALKDDPAEAILAALAIPRPRAVMVLNGGTAKLAEPLQAHLAQALQDGLARVVADEHITVITGGTDAGIFQLFGQGLARWGRTAPCIGVAVADLVTWPGHTQGEAPLEPHHSHFVLVDGKKWGDETQIMYALISTLTQACPSIAVFASGGEICIREMQMNVAQDRQMILLAGSGRATDDVLAARDGQPVDDARLPKIAQEGRIFSWPIAEKPAKLAALLRRALGLDVVEA